MKIYAISDTHNSTFEWINSIPKDTDLIIHCGDISDMGDEYEVSYLMYLMNNIGIPIIMTPGNHDFLFQNDKSKISELCQEYQNITVLINQMTEFNGIKIYGTPYTHEYNGWAFGVDSNEFIKYLPKETPDIIISHCPPVSDALSMANGMEIGNQELTNYLSNNSKEILVLCGHNHLGKVVKDTIGNSVVYNVAEHSMIIDF